MSELEIRAIVHATMIDAVIKAVMWWVALEAIVFAVWALRLWRRK